MAVYRVERTRDYTVMCNYHLKDKALSLKAKGLLSMMLSMPEEWNYSTRGLAAICKEGVEAIGNALKELEKAGYMARRQLRGANGRITDTEYIIYEKPQDTEPSAPEADPAPEGPDAPGPDTSDPDITAPDTDSPYPGFPYMENPYPARQYPGQAQPGRVRPVPRGLGQSPAQTARRTAVSHR